MKNNNLKFFAGLSLALVLAGCGNEASRLGYRGLDVENNDERMFIKLGSTTNWLPARVLSAIEKYKLTEDESAMIAAVGLIEPGALLKSVPDGYKARDLEPWFTTYVCDHSAFGKQGVGGFLSHPLESGEILSGEVFFSTYHESSESALAALAEIQADITTNRKPLKVYPFENCFVAEYRRLLVMAVVGLRADGKWSCMLSVADKNRPGCGQWVPQEEQLERIETLKRLAAESVQSNQ